jgi:glycine dehydrogenase
VFFRGNNLHNLVFLLANFSMMYHTDRFVNRHNGPSAAERQEMLSKIEADSLDQLIDQTIPPAIRLKKPLSGEAMTEYEYHRHLREIAAANKVFRSYIGMGYYGTIIPPVIQRNVLENPGWYTAYTPYQAEIAQGRLEAILNFQTMVIDLTGMPIANASLLDEATAAAEAMAMLFSSRSREQVKNGAVKFFVSNHVFPQSLDVLKTRSAPLGIELVTGDAAAFSADASFFGVMLQYPSMDGSVHDWKEKINQWKAAGIAVAVATDLLSLALLTPPGEWGADVVLGNSQRFGVPMGFGGPHAAFFACRDEYKRLIPGRIIGVSVDAQGNPALRMALQTREQHIRRDKATSNICTAQALLAIMASMYGVYHGPEGIRGIAEHVHRSASLLASRLQAAGMQLLNTTWFDTVSIAADEALSSSVHAAAINSKMNFRYLKGSIAISLDQTVTMEDLNDIISVFSGATGKDVQPVLRQDYQKEGILSSHGLK